MLNEVNTLAHVSNKEGHHVTDLTRNSDLTMLSETLIGTSAAMQHVRSVLSQVAPFNINVLIQGNIGTGKAITAYTLHRLSHREGQFIVINCSALSTQSTLLDYLSQQARPSFPDKHGLPSCNDNTIFLDEIAALSLENQQQLLHFIQLNTTDEINRYQQLSVACRIIASTKEDLFTLSKAGLFSEELLYHLNVITIKLPPLAERLEDIPALVEYFIRQSMSKYKKPYPNWQKSHLTEWLNRPWLGNVRELRNFVDRLVLGCTDGLTDNKPHQQDMSTSLPDKVNLYERKLILQALHAHQYHVANTAKQLQIPKKTLYDKLKKNGIILRESRLTKHMI